MTYVMIIALLGIIVLGSGMMLLTTYTQMASAHTTVSVGKYDIEAGWEIEPPIVGIRNNFVFEISEPGQTEGVKTGVKQAFRNLDATAKFGGVTKTLDINADTRLGHYFSPVIPTKTGSIIINFKGEINGIAVDVDIPVEDVEPTSVLDFPPKISSGDQDISALKTALSFMQKEIDDIKSGGIGDTVIDPGDENTKFVSSNGTAYDLAIFGLSLGAAGVILATIAMVKSKK